MAVGADPVRTIRIVVDASGARDGAQAVERALSSIDDRLAALGQSVTGAFGTIKNALLAFVSIDTIITQVRGLIDAFDRLGQRSKTLGIDTQWMQAFENAAASSTVKIADAGAALEKFSKLVGDGARGQKDAVDTLRELGVKIFDAQKNVRPLSELFVEASRSLDGMESSAKRNSLAAAAVGRDWSRVTPIFGEVAKGSEAMIESAKKAGTIVRPEMVKIWEDLATAADKSMLKWRAFAGENFAESVKKGFDIISGAIGVAIRELAAFAKGLGVVWEGAKSFARESMAASHRADAERLAAPIAKGEEYLESEQRRLWTAEGDVSRYPTGANQKRLAEQRASVATAEKVLGDLRASRDRALMTAFNYGVGTPTDTSAPTRADFGLTEPTRPGGAGGNGFATTTDAGTGDRLNKRLELLKAEEAATRKMAEAALIGAAAVNKEQAEFKALQQALEIMGASAKAGDAAVQDLQKTLVKYDASIANNKAVEKFRLETKELEGQNDVAAKRLEMIDAAPEKVAREIAILQVRNQLNKDGRIQSEADIQLRGDAIEKQELLNQKMEQAKRTQETWLAPLKTMLSGMQQGLAGFFEGILSGGISTFQQLTEGMKKLFIRALAEIAAVAVIRPVLAPIVNGLSGMGVVSPAQAHSLGYGSVGGGGGIPGLGGGGFGGSMFGFLDQSVTGMPSAASYAGVLPGMSGAEAQSYFGGGGLDNLTWGGALAGVGSIGMGAYGLATGNPIGGAAGIIGGGMGLLSSMGLIGSAFGPIGMGIGLVGGLLGSLLGGNKEPPLPPQPNLQLSSGAFYPTASGAFRGRTDGSKQVTQIGSTVSRLFSRAGLTPTSSLLGGQMDVGVDHILQGREWVERPYTQTSLTSGVGNYEMLTTNDPTRNAQQAGDYLTAQVFRQNVLRGGVSGASASLRAGLGAYDPEDAAGVQSVIDLAKAYERLGKSAMPVKDAVDNLSASFDELREFADRAGLSLDPLNAELAKQSERMAQDFIDGMLDPMAVQMRALADEQKAALANAEYIRDNFKNVHVDMDRIATFYTNREKDLREQLYSGAVASLQDAIARLTYGDLSGASPTDTFSGVRGAYNALVAQARSGDSSAIGRLAGAGGQYAQIGQSFYGGGPEYEALKAQIIDDLAEVRARTQTGGFTGGGAASEEAVNTVLAGQAAVLNAMAEKDAKYDALVMQMAEVLAELQRIRMAA